MSRYESSKGIFFGRPMEYCRLYNAVVCSFFFFFFFFPRHLGTIAQLCWAISSQLRHVSTIGKKLVTQHYVLHVSPQYGELRRTSGWDRWTSLGYPCKFQQVSRLGSVTARHLVVGVSQTLRRWTEGATYIWQGDHHFGHWPTFLVLFCFAD